MKFEEILKKAQKFTTDNSPMILTAIGVTGTITTAYLTGKASFKAAKILAEYEDASLTKKEKAQVVWKEYIPPFFAGSLTIAAIVSANQIGTRRTAALAAAYSLSEKAFNEYKVKVVEKIGERKEQGVRDDIAQDRVRERPIADREIIIANSEGVPCFEQFTGRYIRSTIEELRQAQNQINYQLTHEGYASLSEFYALIGLSPTSMSDEVGWNSDRLLELKFTTVLTEDQKPCIAFDYTVEPVRKYFRLH